MNAPSGEPAQKQKHDGNSSRRAPKTAAGSCATGRSTVTSRASTTFSSSPARMRSVAARTDSSYVLGGVTLVI